MDEPFRNQLVSYDNSDQIIPEDFLIFPPASIIFEEDEICKQGVKNCGATRENSAKSNSNFIHCSNNAIFEGTLDIFSR